MSRRLCPPVVLLLACAVLPAAEPSNARKPKADAELKYWLQNMVWHHRFSNDEIADATGLARDDITAALKRFDIRPDNRPKRPADAPLLVLPYPGGRHPRAGFLDGAVRPQRETKVSVFTPWDEDSYVVADVPEAIWCQHGLLYLAHTHVPTVWTKQKIDLEPLEWERKDGGVLEVTRKLPDGVSFGARVLPGKDGVRMELWLTNSGKEKLTDLRVQNCLMLKGAAGFAKQVRDNKVHAAPYAAARSEDGKRWVIWAWGPHDRCRDNPPCPCIHSDPNFPDCAPGETMRLRGWLSFYEGDDVKAEFRRLDKLGWREEQKPERPRGEDEATELGKLAASMKPGTWAELSTRGYTAELLKVQNHHILEYTGAAAWDPTSRQVLFVGQGHYSALKFISYDAAANAWKLRETPPWWKGDAQTGKGPIGHAYYNNAIDPARGVFYLHQSATRLVHCYDVAKEEWKTLPEIAGAATGHGTAIAYFPERKGLLRVLGGTVHFFSEEKNEWTKLGDKLSMGPYHNVAHYSAVGKVVLFGGGNNSKDLYKLDAAGKITQLKPAPVEVGINTTVVTSDPVSGNFLVLHKDDKFYSFDAAEDAWKELGTEGMPFRMKGSSFDVVATPVSNYGVTLFFTAERKGLKVYLYKHTASRK